MPKILCAGLIAADLVFEVGAFPVKGDKTRANGSRLITGGGALNAATAIAALGGSACLAGTIGDDIFGQFLRGKLTERGIDGTLVRTGGTTSRSANLITADGDRTIVNHRDDLARHPLPEIPSGFPYDAALVDTRWPAAAEVILAAARTKGVPAVVDAEAPVAPAEAALGKASHVVFSAQGLKDYTGGDDANALAEATRRLGVWCAVTRGARPVLYHDGHNVAEVATVPVTARNTLGAGDMWHAAFTFALCTGQSELAAIQWANVAAALKVRRPLQDDHWPSAGDVAERLALSKEGHHDGD